MELGDIELVTLAKTARTSAAFETLVRRHQSALRAFLLRMTGDAALSDDLAQEAFLKAFRAIEGFRGGSSFRSWLFSIAIREAQMAQRKSAAQSRITNAAAELDGTEAPREFSIDLQRALLSLSAEERAAALLCDAAGLSHAEAASAMGAPLGTVKTLVARAREKLRAAMASDEEHGGAGKGAACA